jgi:hypothetical protein
MKTKVNECLRGLCPPNPLGFIALRPIPQEGRHARAAEAAQACGLWAKRGAQVASQRSLILRLGPAMLPATHLGHQRLIPHLDPAGRMAGFESSDLQLVKSRL